MSETKIAKAGNPTPVELKLNSEPKPTETATGQSDPPNPPKQDPPKQDPPKQDPPKQDPPKMTEEDFKTFMKDLLDILLALT